MSTVEGTTKLRTNSQRHLFLVLQKNIQHDVNDTKIRLEAASNDLKLAAELIPTATEIREDLPDAVNQLNETIESSK